MLRGGRQNTPYSHSARASATLHHNSLREPASGLHRRRADEPASEHRARHVPLERNERARDAQHSHLNYSSLFIFWHFFYFNPFPAVLEDMYYTHPLIAYSNCDCFN